MIKLAFTLFLIWFGCTPNSDESTPPTLFALVNGTAIHESDLKERLEFERWKYPDFKKPKRFNQLKHKTLKEMINQRIVLDWGNKQGIVLTPEEEALGLASLKQGYTEKEFLGMLEERKSTFQIWKIRALENLTFEKIIATTLKPQVSLAEIEDNYNKNKDLYIEPESVRVRHLVTDTKEKADAIYTALLQGENFAKMAILHSLSPERSNGGELDYFARGTHPQAFDEVCFGLSPGEISPVIQTVYGFHIFKLLDKRPARLKPVDEVKAEIEADLLKKKVDTMLPKWLEQIKEGSQIKIFEHNLSSLEPF